MKLVTVAEMRALEEAAVNAGSSYEQMMEEAGLAVAQEAWMMLGTLEGRRILVLAGPGNNGGDGIVAARHLADWGAEVGVYLPRKRRDESLLEALGERENASLFAGEEDEDGERLHALTVTADLVIDALLGIGQKRVVEAEEPIGRALVKLAEARKSFSPPKLIAVDLPTGIDADSGAVSPVTVIPDLTVTFGLPKVGMYQAPASGMLGKVQVIGIGIPEEAMAAVGLELMTTRWARGEMPVRPEDGNKGTFGRVIVLGGSRRYSGAVRLAAAGSYRTGAGLVTIACPEPVMAVAAAGLPEATWLPQTAAEDGGLMGEAALALRNDWEGFDAAVVGPGMGNSEETRALTWALMADVQADVKRGVVFDADALNALATMADAGERMPSHAILTPHPGEMARLLKTTVADVQDDRLGAAKRAAAAFNCVVVLKGAHTVVAAADGRAALSPFANPLLATAGSGDVLAGMIGGYLAQGKAPFEAACLGVYLHGATGEALREEYGEAGLLAGEIADRLPKVVREIGSV